ncbi:hypothetical protein [Thermoplasma volcanium]|uniref:hypothetical protein n=1 Tax=Thermoplasma volcanium TaxID=50339 RepID=UPI00064F9B6E|nr:hypothetical protein [Thermoplasma volcanium]
MKAVLNLDVPNCKKFMEVLTPDNYGSISMDCIDHKISITVEEKPSTLFNVLIDIVTSYEIYIKISSLFDV